MTTTPAGIPAVERIVGIGPEFQDTPLKRAVVDLAAGATADIIAAVSGKKIKVLAIYAKADVAGTVVFKSGTTAISGAIPFVTGDTDFSPPWCPQGLFQTASGEAFAATTVTATFDGFVLYQEVDA